MKSLIIFLAIIGIAFADELADCKCHEGYEPKKEPSGDVRCYGIYLKAIMPCNVPKRPRCVCTSDATGVVHDHTGIWCGQFKRGVELKRWDCENKEEWEEFFRQHPRKNKSV